MRPQSLLVRLFLFVCSCLYLSNTAGLFRSISLLSFRVWSMMLADLGGAPLGVAAGPWNWLGFESYCCKHSSIWFPKP
jgi:hypothetical protein